ncbi:MAG: HpcH/HpaI aldolase/citrate lyase family protein [Bellilinea sp.]
MPARRAMLYVPADDERKIHKAAGLDVDSICLDIEDGVAVNRKSVARENIAAALRTGDFGRSERLVRINPLGSGLAEEDLRAVLAAQPDGIVLPKVEGADEVQWVCREIAAAEQANGWKSGSIGLLVLIETPQAVLNLREICTADLRLQGLIFGAEDFAGSIGAVRSRDALELLYARSAVVIHAAAFNLQAMDMVWLDLKDLEGLRQEAQAGAALGFTGKQIIHPNQVQPVQEAFTPSEEAIQSARRIIEAAQAYQQAGKGAFALDGKMVDAPVIKAALRVLERARAAGRVA